MIWGGGGGGGGVGGSNAWYSVYRNQTGNYGC